MTTVIRLTDTHRFADRLREALAESKLPLALTTRIHRARPELAEFIVEDRSQPDRMAYRVTVEPYR